MRAFALLFASSLILSAHPRAFVRVATKPVASLTVQLLVLVCTKHASSIVETMPTQERVKLILYIPPEVW